MSPRKLNEDDKQKILQLYRNSEATTSTLATRYEVSSSTVSRFLKNKLSQSEYEDLIQQKRLARTPRGEKSASPTEETTVSETKISNKSEAQVNYPETIVTVDSVEPRLVIEKEESESVAESTSLFPRRRRRSSAISEPVETVVATSIDLDPIKKQSAKIVIDKKPSGIPKVIKASERLLLKKDRIEEIDDDDDEVGIITLKEMLGEDLADINDDEDDDDDDDWEPDNEDNITYPHAGSGNSKVQILPLSAASFPKTCYLVIDRAAELIVKPLADFADLGSIPQEEVKQKTLPVFDNHRIAKRFSHRRERVIKVPDGQILQKTSRYLQEKGITRLLIDGQLYSLSSDL
jgi:transposase-like protein